MVNNFSGFSNDGGEGLIYDLRQTYAQILDEVLKRIATSRVNDSYSEWFNALEHLEIEINQKLKPKEREDYKKEYEKCVKVLQQNAAAFNGLSKDPDSIYKVKCSLRDLEKWLKIKMEEHKLFGSKREAEGLI